MKIEPSGNEDQLHNQSNLDLKSVYRSLLNIVALLDGNEYTEGMLRQTTEQQLDDLADPASDEDTRRAETHCT